LTWINGKMRMIKILDVSSLVQTCGGDSVFQPELTSLYFGCSWWFWWFSFHGIGLTQSFFGDKVKGYEGFSFFLHICRNWTREVMNDDEDRVIGSHNNGRLCSLSSLWFIWWGSDFPGFVIQSCFLISDLLTCIK
jgi:hypothetical protein